MPLVLTRSKSVFLHIPKTGGTWVRYVLRKALVPWTDYGYQHATYEESSEVFPLMDRFCIVRNPLAWYQSFWAAREIEGWHGDWLIEHGCIDPDFNRFVYKVCLRRPGFLTDLYEQYTTPETYILRTETLATDLADFLSTHNEQYLPEALNEQPLNRSATLDTFSDRVRYEQSTLDNILRSEEKLFGKYEYTDHGFR